MYQHHVPTPKITNIVQRPRTGQLATMIRTPNIECQGQVVDVDDHRRCHAEGCLDFLPSFTKIFNWRWKGRRKGTGNMYKDNHQNIDHRSTSKKTCTRTNHARHVPDFPSCRCHAIEFDWHDVPPERLYHEGKRQKRCSKRPGPGLVRQLAPENACQFVSRRGTIIYCNVTRW